MNQTMQLHGETEEDKPESDEPDVEIFDCDDEDDGDLENKEDDYEADRDTDAEKEEQAPEIDELEDRVWEEKPEEEQIEDEVMNDEADDNIFEKFNPPPTIESEVPQIPEDATDEEIKRYVQVWILNKLDSMLRNSKSVRCDGLWVLDR